MFTGVPCSMLKPIINHVIQRSDLDYIAASSEGEAVAIAAGAQIRVRIGVGRPRDDTTVEDFVLSPFEEEEEGLLVGVLHRGVGAVEAILRDGAAVAMNTFN